MRNLLRATGVLGLVFLALAATVLPAGAAGTVAPRQFFTGVINGKAGNTTKQPIDIKVACVGAVGHPIAGQTMAVQQLFPPTRTQRSLGYTGKASEIGVFFNVPPPYSPARRALVFTQYDQAKALPPSLTLPCDEKGEVWFAPIPSVPPSLWSTIKVQFVRS